MAGDDRITTKQHIKFDRYLLDRDDERVIGYAELREIGRLGLLSQESIAEVREDYCFLRFLENRIQALRDNPALAADARDDTIAPAVNPNR